MVLQTDDIKQKLKQQSIQAARQQGIYHEATPQPAWISSVSWWIGGIICFITFVAVLIATSHAKNPDHAGGFFVGVLGGIFYGFVAKGISYLILAGIFHGGKYAKKGTVAAAKEGSKLLDNATTAVAKKISIAVEKGKSEAKLEQEKQRLRDQINDLELQALRKRVEELEKKALHK